MPWLMFLAFLMSIALPIVVLVAGINFIKRTRSRGIGGGGLEAAILDSLERVHIRLDALNDRMAALEEKAGAFGRERPAELAAGKRKSAEETA